jgi:hypothetical protein
MRHHPLPFDTGQDERILGPLSLQQTLWLAAGGFAAYQLMKIPLPFPGIFAYVHALIPLVPALAFGFISVNNIPLSKYLLLMYSCRRRKRVFRYRG